MIIICRRAPNRISLKSENSEYKKNGERLIELRKKINLKLNLKILSEHCPRHEAILGMENCKMNLTN